LIRINLELLSTWPTPKKIKILIIFSVILLIIIYPLLMYFFFISNYPVSVLESQLSFSGIEIKSHYASMNQEGINLYIIANILDYGFMLSYGLLIFTLALVLARKFKKASIWMKFGFIIAIFGIIAASCDGIENIFIFLMASDPSGFPNSWAVVHSIFALIKYILLIIAISWILIAVAAYFFKFYFS
jgi:hypothetical protein